jgi:hypothetical protein
MTSALLLLLAPKIALALGQKTMAADLKARAERAAIVTSEEALSLPLAIRETGAASAYIWQGLESGWNEHPAGFNDHGLACGSMQVHWPEKYLPGSTCAALRADYRLSVRAGLAVLSSLYAQCGSLGAAWTAYSTGNCPKGKWVLPLVAVRCKLAGLTSTCEALPAH